MADRYRAGKRLWSTTDDRALRRRFPHTPTATIARQLRRSYSAICLRAAKLGLHKSAAYLAEHRRAGGDRLRTYGAPSRFPKGHIPANAGLRRPGWSPGRMRETQFKHGARSGKAADHWMPIGSTRLVDGYLYVKVSDVPNVPYTVNWTLQHRLLWAQAHGPIPAGHALVFQNGDKRDVRLDNLELITRRELMARNTVHTLPKPLAKAVLLLGALKRQLRRRTRDGEHDRRSA